MCFFSWCKTNRYDLIRQLPTTQHLSLKPFPPWKISELACDILKVDKLPEKLERVLQERSQGNPLFVKEMAYMLKDQSTIRLSEVKKLIISLSLFFSLSLLFVSPLFEQIYFL